MLSIHRSWAFSPGPLSSSSSHVHQRFMIGNGNTCALTQMCGFGILLYRVRECGGGILIQPPHPLAIGTILELEIDIPTEPEPILAIGQVSHMRESGCGVEFLLIDEADRDKVVRYIFERERTSQGAI